MDTEGTGLTATRLWLEYKRYPFVLAKILTFALVAFGLIFCLRAVADVLTPVFVAVLLAYLLDPSVDRFEAMGFSRTVGIALFLAIGAIIMAIFVLFLYPTVSHLMERIGAGFPALVDLVENQALPWLQANTGMEVPASFGAAFEEYGDTLRAQIPSFVKTATTTIGDVWTKTGTIVASILNLVLVPILTFYFLRDFDRMRLAAVEYLPSHNRDWLLLRIERMDEVVGAWFRGQIEVALILAGLYAVGLGITFGLSGSGVMSGVAIGILAGLLNVVPYFGFLVGFVLSVLLALLDWSGWMPLVGVGLTFAIVQGLEGYVVTPRIVGEKVGLSPPVVIIALLLGGELLGFLGVLLALPVAGIVRVLLPDLVEWYRRTDLYIGPGGAVAVAPVPVPALPIAPAPGVSPVVSVEEKK